MILLLTATTNVVELTLKEKSTLTTPYYLFEFTNDSSKDVLLFTAADTSLNKDRYNKFNITLTGGSTNYSAGTIGNLSSGFYQYNIYEQTAQYNLHVSATTSTVETGKVYVSGATIFNNVVLSGSDTPNYVVL
jgi:hypothetical protein